jgi:hypothetical protein
MSKMFLVSSILLIGLAGTASAAYLDLTVQTAPGVPSGTNSGFIGTGFFIRNDASSTGTGVIDSFVEITGNNEVKEAFNTTVNNVLDNGSADNFNHALLFSDLGVVNNPYTGVASYRFLLDINENSSEQRFLSLDELEIWRTTANNPGSYAALTAAPAFKVYDMTSGIDPTNCRDMAGAIIPCDTQTFASPAGLTQGVLTDYTLNNGSGSGDMFFYIPTSAFAGTSGNFVYLYSKFGAVGNQGTGANLRAYGNSDGFEEWARVEGGSAVPEPSQMLVLSLLSVPLVLAHRRRQRNKA